jgi:hypothetical protein
MPIFPGVIVQDMYIFLPITVQVGHDITDMLKYY